MAATDNPNKWDEATSQRYIDYGRYFVPEREAQIRMVADLVSSIAGPGRVIELCCGEGLLAELLLDELPYWTYQGLDGSDLMLAKAGVRLSRFGTRCQLHRFDLAEHSWRDPGLQAQAVVSMMAIHHLDGDGKRMLFKDIYRMLSAGGVLVISDMIEPASDASCRVAADAWDAVVQKRSQELDGDLGGFDFFRDEGWNTFRFQDPGDIDHPSPLFQQLEWLELAGFSQIDVHFLQAGHALFSGWKLTSDEKGSL
jgi:tRNA (cmo5U34)-methyltransferase